MIARCGDGSWSSREAISARSEPGSSEPVGQVAGEAGQLDEEQRVAAAAVDELVDLAGRRARACCSPRSSDVADQRRGVVPVERTERDLQHERAVDVRRPHDVGVGSLGRDEQERQVGERAHDDRRAGRG